MADVLFRQSCKRLCSAAAVLLAVAGCVLVSTTVQASGAGAAAAANSVTILNGDTHGATMRFDTHGDAIDAHDGEIDQFHGRYYLYGTSYGCGYVRRAVPATPFCGFKSYTSLDLVHWTPMGFLFDASTPTWQSRCESSTLSCYRPHVIYNAATSRYVLWLNSYDAGDGYHVLTSTSPTGPFQEVAVPTLAHPGGDFDLFVAADGTGYIAYANLGDNYNIAIEQLNPAFTNGTGLWTSLGLHSVEAPSVFQRNGTYYVDFSDPNCGYCAATGTSYLTAKSPLGPYAGVEAAHAEIVRNALYDSAKTGLTTTGQKWANYDLAFTTTPLATGARGTVAQSGWLFRAADQNNGYLWILGSSPTSRGYLTKVTLRAGKVLHQSVRTLSMPVVAGQQYSVLTRLQGSKISTWINGVLVDTTVDTTYASGRIGVREAGTESAYFDDVTVTGAGTTLLSSTFSTSLTGWDLASTFRHGTQFTDDSCGGQPDDVATIADPAGTTYLYESDRWNFADENEALATQYWEPLEFRADGSIQPLQCAESYSVPLTGGGTAPVTDPVGPAPTPGDVGFRARCDIAGAMQRAQTFTATASGTLTNLTLTVYQTGQPDGPLQLQVTDATSLAPAAGPPLSSTSLLAASVSWSPAQVSISPDVDVTAGHRYAVLALSPNTTRGCFGTVFALDDVYPGGDSLLSGDSGNSWLPQAQHDLRFTATIR